MPDASTAKGTCATAAASFEDADEADEAEAEDAILLISLSWCMVTAPE